MRHNIQLKQIPLKKYQKTIKNNTITEIVQLLLYELYRLYSYTIKIVKCY